MHVIDSLIDYNKKVFRIIHYTRFYSSTRRNSLWWFQQIASIAIADLHIQALLASMEFAHTHTHTHFVTNHHMKKCVSLIFVWIAIKKFFPQFKNFAKLHQSISKKELVPKWCQTISAMCNSDLVLILCLGK